MPARTARALAREQITADILSAARARLTSQGPGELSLRAVARDVGMVSSAVYRYFASRDDLLTALLVLAYDELGAAVERADADVTDRADTRARWSAACHAFRDWSVAHPGDHALLYGSPVPGYVAPQETIAPATRGTAVLVEVVASATHPSTPDDGGLRDLLGDAYAFMAARGLDASPDVVAATVIAWTTMIGTISFELFGHLEGSVTDQRAWFDVVVRRLADDVGL